MMERLSIAGSGPADGSSNPPGCQRFQELFQEANMETAQKFNVYAYRCV
jgi:hypothetical protein